MTWTIKIDSNVSKDIKKMDSQNRTRIVNFINSELANLTNPRQIGKALTGRFKGMWRYRVGDYRIICQIIDNELTIIAVEIGHRKEIYK